MGVKSKYHRYREAGEAANINNVANFGAPVRSLFTSTKVFTVHHRITITDENENVVYKAQSKFFTLHDTTDIFDANDQHVAHIRKKILSFHERHFVTMKDGTEFELSNEFFHIIKDITNIEGLNWQLRGNIAELNFQLYDQNDRIIALISQKMISLHDKYCIDIYQPQQEQKVVAILVALQHMIRDRENARSSSSSSSSSD